MYKAKYWDAVQGDHLPSGVDISVADFGVNAGL
jgi:lysozyme family protein